MGQTKCHGFDLISIICDSRVFIVTFTFRLFCIVTFEISVDRGYGPLRRFALCSCQECFHHMDKIQL